MNIRWLHRGWHASGVSGVRPQPPGAACSDGGDAGGGAGASPVLCPVQLPAPVSLTASTHCALLSDGASRGAGDLMRRMHAAVWRGAAAVLDLPPGVGEYGANMEGPDKARSMLGGQMTPPLRHVGLGLRMQSGEVTDAALAAGAGQAERNLKGRPAALCSLQGASGTSVRERSGKLHERYAEL